MPSDQQLSLSWRDAAWVAALAGAFAALVWQAGLAAGPFEGDPDYIYLLSGLQILNFVSPHYYTHPGTPVEMIAALVMLGAWLLRMARGAPSDAVLADPEFYLGANSLLFMLAIGVSLVVFAIRLRRFAGAVPAIAGALSLFLFLPAFLALHRVTPEPLLLAASLVLAALIAPFAFAPRGENRRDALAIGATIGFCLALKATAAPLLILILVLRAPRLRLTALAAAVVAAIVFTLPVAPHYGEMLLWYVGLFTHQGGYGSGAAGLPPLSQLWSDAIGMMAAMPETFLCLALCLVILAGQRKLRRAEPGRRVLVICTVLVAIDLLAVLKQPEPRYTVPAVAFLCLANAIAAKTWLDRFKPAAWAGASAVALLAVLGFWREQGRLENLAAERAPGQALLQKTAATGCYLMPYYSVNTVAFNLFFGDAWNGFMFRGALARLYPQFMTFDGNHHVFPTFGGDLTPAQAEARFAGHRCSYWVGSPLERYDDFGIAKDQFTLVARSPGSVQQAVAVYRVKPGWQNTLPK